MIRMSTRRATRFHTSMYKASSELFSYSLMVENTDRTKQENTSKKLKEKRRALFHRICRLMKVRQSYYDPLNICYHRLYFMQDTHLIKHNTVNLLFKSLHKWTKWDFFHSRRLAAVSKISWEIKQDSDKSA